MYVLGVFFSDFGSYLIIEIMKSHKDDILLTLIFFRKDRGAATDRAGGSQGTGQVSGLPAASTVHL